MVIRDMTESESGIKVVLGDCLERLRELPDCSVDSVVTDPPYGLSFMGKKWDYDVPSVEVWAECLRVLKPGGYLLAFAGTRTQHRMAVRIEDAGFEIRDMIAWVYGSGFPKSLDVSKAIDKAAGAEREVVGQRKKLQSYGADANDVYGGAPDKNGIQLITAPATPEAQQWAGWGTALKPALEPITMARKPLVGTVAANVLQHGTGALNVDGCRVGTGEALGRFNNARTEGSSYIVQREAGLIDNSNGLGRWPANLIHDGSDEVVGLFPVTGASKATPRNNGNFKSVAKGRDLPHVTYSHDDNGGSAARFFYCAKASKKDRDEGCEGLEARRNADWPQSMDGNDERGAQPRRNHHPTVKPADLMRYLCRLVTQPGGVVLDPFMGSGSTGKAAVLEGFRFVGIEREAEYLEIAKSRIAAAYPLSGLQSD
jgi:DNA modification methylase